MSITFLLKKKYKKKRIIKITITKGLNEGYFKYKNQMFIIIYF